MIQQQHVMNNLERFCPEIIADCIRMFLVHFGKKAGPKSKNQSNGIDELEEEEFQFSPSSTRFHHQEQKQANIASARTKDPPKVQQEHEETLNFKVNFNHASQRQSEETTKLYQIQAETSYQLTNFNFKLNLQPYDQYYPLIESKTKNIKQIFESNTKNILTRKSKSMVSIQQIETITGFKMIITYRLPCSYAYFKTVNKEFEVISKLNPVISSNKNIETIHPNLTINYLSFKKFMLLQPRFFNYLKYQNSTQNNHWDICTSIKSRPQSQPTEKECELTSISCFEERKTELVVNTYLQVDLKSNLRASKVVLRVYQEVATYIDNLYDYITENYRLQQV